MARVEVLETSALTPMFVGIIGETPHTASKRHFNNVRYRTMLIETRPETGARKKDKFSNYIQLALPRHARELQLKFPDETFGISSSVIAHIMDAHKGRLAFGLGDIRPDAPFLFFKDRASKDITKMLGWMRENLSDPALVIRHRFCFRVSFTDENDFVLARLKFA